MVPDLCIFRSCYKDLRPGLVLSPEGIFYRCLGGPVIPWTALRGVGGSQSAISHVGRVLHAISKVVAYDKIGDLSGCVGLDVGPDWRRYCPVSSWYAPFHVALQAFAGRLPIAIERYNLEATERTVLLHIARFRPDLVPREMLTLESAG